MRAAFNIVMRAVSSLLGVLVACMGGIWILQAFNIAFLHGFMVGDKHWALYGAIVVLVGIAQIAWSNMRQVT